MKVVIFAGGMGTRISEESQLRPKPMIEIGGKPILWHIMKLYESHGFNDFVICLGYKGYMIKEYFMNYYMHNSDITIDLTNNEFKIHQSKAENFKITLVDTGLDTKTAGRLKKVKDHIGAGTFMLTYGDGLADINLKELLAFHHKHGKTATVSSIQPAGRYGSLDIDRLNNVNKFIEKPKGDGFWINGGFFILNSNVFDYLNGDCEDVMWEDSPLEKLAVDGELFAFKHEGFWKAMDALRDKIELEEMWNSGKPKWKCW
jgi:glucose-1-phosphate cytidylyltransferase